MIIAKKDIKKSMLDFNFIEGFAYQSKDDKNIIYVSLLTNARSPISDCQLLNLLDVKDIIKNNNGSLSNISLDFPEPIRKDELGEILGPWNTIKDDLLQEISKEIQFENSKNHSNESMDFS